MPCNPLNAETPNNNHHPILKSFPILQILVHITLDSGFRRNDELFPLGHQGGGVGS